MKELFLELSLLLEKIDMTKDLSVFEKVDLLEKMKVLKTGLDKKMEEKKSINE